MPDPYRMNFSPTSPDNGISRGKAVVIVSHDCITPLGDGSDATFRNALESRSGIRRLTCIDTDGIPVKFGGEAVRPDLSHYPFLSARELKNWFSPVIPHALIVVHRALRKSGLIIDESNRERIGMLVSSAIGGVGAVLAAHDAMAAGRLPHPFSNPNTCLNMIGGKAAIMSGAGGPIYSPVAACATGAVSVACGVSMIQSGRVDAAVCGAVDFPLHPTILTGFATMNGVFQSDDPRDRSQSAPALSCRPFSEDRKGFLVSEGAAALILASESYARAKGLPVEGYVAGIGMNSDAHHFVVPFQETITRCMQIALDDAGIEPGDVDYVNAHAASTRVGDAVEVRALEDVFGREARVPVSSNKSQLGHTMGASSAIEIILCLMGMKEGWILPTINLLPDPEFALDFVPHKPRRADLRYVLSNSFGFGGCNCCVILRRADC